MRKLTDADILLIAQIIVHLSIIPMIIYASWYHYLLSILIYFLTGCIGMTMTYHRLLSHRVWPKAPKWLTKIGSIFGTLGLTGSTIGWCAIHRKHHRYTDQEQDPHSPKYKGFFNVQWLSMYEKPNPKYVIDLSRDSFHRFLHENYWYINLLYVIAIFVLIDPFAVVYLYLFPAMILWNYGSFINTVNHIFGYRNHDTDDYSTNNFITGYFMWGEGWHNNHHNSPKQLYFGEKWWEFDMGGFILLTLQKIYSK